MDELITDLAAMFNKVKGIHWDQAVVSFYVVNRRLIERKAKYNVLYVNADEVLRKKLRDAICESISAATTAKEYDYNTIDMNNDFLSIETGRTDFQSIIDLIRSGDTKDASNFSDLISSWMYIARLDIQGTSTLYAARKVSTGWNAKKVDQFINLIFRDNMLVDIDQNNLFRIDSKIDFMAYDTRMFICDKNNFELALNFRAGMVTNRDVVVEEFKQFSLFEDAAAILTLVGNNMRYLRKLSQIKEAGYYRDPTYVNKLKLVNDKKGWGLQYDSNGKLKVDDKNIDLVLLLLNNDRLMSEINEENFDVDVKHKV